MGDENHDNLLEKLTNVDTYELSDYVRIGQRYNYNSERYGFPYTYYVFDVVNQSKKAVFLDATFNEKLFRYLLYSYNGEIGFYGDTKVKIYQTKASNKDTVIYHMKPGSWHPKCNFINPKKPHFI